MATKITENQLPSKYREIVEEQLQIAEKGASVQVMNSIPPTYKIPKENLRAWLKIPDVICVYVDMLGSTKLSANTVDPKTAVAYQLFTGSAVRLFSAFEAPYIDVRGDGVFALFNKTQPYRAIAAAVTFKTFARMDCIPYIQDLTNTDVGTHIGIDQETVLVRKVGLKRHNDRTDRQNEVWAGKPVNMAAKLASLASDNELIVSDRYFENIRNELVLYSCGCSNGESGGEKVYLWEEKDVEEDPRFDFDKAFVLTSLWCNLHGKEYLEKILALDEN